MNDPAGRLQPRQDHYSPEVIPWWELALTPTSFRRIQRGDLIP